MTDGPAKKISARMARTMSGRGRRLKLAVLCAGALEIRLNICGERRGREHPRGCPPPQYPAPQRRIVGDVERQHQAAVVPLAQRLRRMPDARADVRSDAR